MVKLTEKALSNGERNCYECETTESVEAWPLISTKILVPLCHTCRAKLSYVFQSVEEAVFKKEEKEKKGKGWRDSIWPGLLLVFMIFVGGALWVLHILGVFR